MRRPVERVVSLVPSITEALVEARREAVVGATDWCSHPSDLDVVRVRGTKNPDLRRIIELHPDVVISNREENRRIDVERLRSVGIRVWVSQIETVPDAFEAYDELFDRVLHWPRPAWLDQARQAWLGPVPDPVAVIAVPIWRDPWMVIGARTFTGDLLRRLGRVNVFADPAANPDQQRYPHVEVDRIDASGADEIWLPDEPYIFTADDGPEAFSATPTRLVSGRLITWYGPSLLQARVLA